MLWKGVLDFLKAAKIRAWVNEEPHFILMGDCITCSPHHLCHTISSGCAPHYKRGLTLNEKKAHLDLKAPWQEELPMIK